MIKYNGKAVTYGGNWLDAKRARYNPLGLPPFTMRLQFSDGYNPNENGGMTYGTITQVSSTPNVWDWTYVNSDWGSRTQNGNSILAPHNLHLVAVLGANSDGVTSMSSLLSGLATTVGGMLTAVALFDTSSVVNMKEMFTFQSSLTSIPGFDTGNVTNMVGLFGYCTSLSDVPHLNTGRVTNMGWMFAHCQSLSNFPTMNTRQVTDMKHMFINCKSMTDVPVLYTSKVTDMEYMFDGCEQIQYLPELDTRNVTSMRNFCSGCKNLKYVPLLSTESLDDSQSAFQSCYKVDSGALALYNQMSSQPVPPSIYRWTFNNCGRDTTTGAAELAQIPASWGGTMS